MTEEVNIDENLVSYIKDLLEAAENGSLKGVCVVAASDDGMNKPSIVGHVKPSAVFGLEVLKTRLVNDYIEDVDSSD